MDEQLNTWNQQQQQQPQ